MPDSEHETVLALMDDGSYVTAVVKAKRPGGWLLLNYHELTWWAEVGEYRTDDADAR